MQKLQYSIDINAPRETVWHSMLDDATYREWTEVFSKGSYYKGSWEQGSKILFLGPDPEGGSEGGLVSEIAENRPYEFVSIKHVGIVANGVEDTTSDEAKKWTPAYENYSFIDKNGATELQVELEVDVEHSNAFDKMWPEGLQRLKSIAER